MRRLARSLKIRPLMSVILFLGWLPLIPPVFFVTRTSKGTGVESEGYTYISANRIARFVSRFL